jgi:hypothetical protein
MADTAKQNEWTVNSPSAAHEALSAALALPRALYAGTGAMRAAARSGAQFLPQSQREDSSDYLKRVEKTVLYNGFKRTVDSLVGRPFSKPVQWGEDVPDIIQEWGENIDLDGRNVTVFSRDSFRDGWISGAGMILAEAPIPEFDAEGRPIKRNLLQEQRSKVRPWLVHVPAERVIFVRSAIVNGVRVPTQVRIRQHDSLEVGQWGEECRERVRVLYPGKWELWEAGGAEHDDWTKAVMIASGPSSMPYIPIYPFYTQQTGFMECAPPLVDLAELNGRHWQSSSDLAHILHVTNFPVLFLEGELVGDDDDEAGAANTQTVEHGPNVMYHGKPDSDLKFVEPKGEAIQRLESYISTLEEQMATLGMEPLLPRRKGAETAYGRALDSKEAFSALGATVLSYKGAIEAALMAAAEMMKVEVKREQLAVEINMDFGITPREAQDLEALKFAREKNDISREAYLFELKRRGVLHDGYDADTDAELLDDEMDEQELGAFPGAAPGRPVAVPKPAAK